MAIDIENDSGTVQQSLLLRRRLAEAMMKQGMESGPVGHPLGAVARAMAGLMGGMQVHDLEEKELALRNADINATRAMQGLPPIGSTTKTNAAPTVAQPTSTQSGSQEPLSVRTNNVGAIKDGDFARSQPGYAGTEGAYAKFDTRENGYAATDKLLAGKSYLGGGNNTVAGIITRYAPPDADNNSTGLYIKTVSDKLGVGPNDPIPPEKAQLLTEAIAGYEAGKPVPRPQAVAQAPAAPQAPVATPTAPVQAAPVAPNSAPGQVASAPAMTSAQIREQAIKNLGPSVTNYIGRSKLAQQLLDKEIERLTGAQEPTDTVAKAKIDKTRAETGKDLVTAAKTQRELDVENAKPLPRTRDQLGMDASKGLSNVLQNLDNFGQANVERAIGPTVGQEPQKDSTGGVGLGAVALNAIPSVARVGGQLDYLVNGGTSPEAVRSTLRGDMDAVAANIKDLVRQKGEGTFSDKDQALLSDIVGSVTTASNVDEARRAVHNARKRIMDNWHIDIPELTAPGQSANKPAQLMEQRGLVDTLLGRTQQMTDAEAEKARITEEIRKRFSNPAEAEAFLRKIQGGM